MGGTFGDDDGLGGAVLEGRASSEAALTGEDGYGAVS